MPDPYIIFQVADTHYAVRSDQVQQIGMVENITHVPNTPPFVEGVAYLRGKVVPVINLRQRFGLEKSSYDQRSRLVVTQINSRVVALAVDSSREFLFLDEEQIQPPPDTLTGPGTEYLEGVAALDRRLILVMNMAQLLSDQEKEALTAADTEIEPAP